MSLCYEMTSLDNNNKCNALSVVNKSPKIPFCEFTNNLIPIFPMCMNITYIGQEKKETACCLFMQKMSFKSLLVWCLQYFTLTLLQFRLSCKGYKLKYLLVSTSMTQFRNCILIRLNMQDYANPLTRFTIKNPAYGRN